MDAVQLERETWAALGFELIWSTGGGIYHLRRNGGLTIGGGVTIDKAWAQAPTLDALIPKLVEGMVGKDTEYYIFDLAQVENGWTIGIEKVYDDSVFVRVADAPTMAHAVASVFVQMCAEGLIDGKAVTL